MFHKEDKEREAKAEGKEWMRMPWKEEKEGNGGGGNDRGGNERKRKEGRAIWAKITRKGKGREEKEKKQRQWKNDTIWVQHNSSK